MRRDPAEYEGRQMDLVYIAGALEEAQKLEALLDQAGFDYVIEVEQYRSGVIFASVRAGAFFYVEPESATRCRQVLSQAGYSAQGEV